MSLFTSTAQADGFVRQAPYLAAVRELSPRLSPAEMRGLAAQILTLIRDYYVHLPVKTSALGVDPVQQLLLLADDIPYLDSDITFCSRLMDIITSLRDRHTCLTLPSPWAETVAFLPFTVEACWENGRRLLVVSKLLGTLPDPAFTTGVEITHWNGVPIDRHVELVAAQTDGANPSARIAVALRSLTARPLAYQLPPDEDWVTLTFRPATGPVRSLVVPWRVYFLPPAGAPASGGPAGGSAPRWLGVDRPTLAVNGIWRDLYSRPTGAARAVALGAPAAAPPPDNSAVSTIEVDGTSYGYLRIYSFDAPDVAAYLAEMAATLRAMPPAGLVVDVRANPGGAIPAGEGLLRLLTDRPVVTEPVEFRVTDRTQTLVAASPDLSSWRRSFDLRYETGAQFSQGFGLSDPSLLGTRAGGYPGPVVLVVDALCYSTTDFFAAGFQDNGLGRIIGVDPVTGAGGANVWTYTELRQAVATTAEALPALPRNFDVNISLRRSTRVGVNRGIPLEGLGVTADIGYRLTRRDVLGDNADLLAFAARTLRAAG